VDLQRHLVGVEDDRRHPGRADRRRQKGLGLLRHLGRVGDEVEAPDQLPALGAVLPQDSGVRPPLGLAVADGGGVDHGAALDDPLVDAAALARHEPLLGVPHLVRRGGLGHTGVDRGAGGGDEQVAPLGQPDLVERVLVPTRRPRVDDDGGR
jgi:hypothetical protein